MEETTQAEDERVPLSDLVGTEKLAKQTLFDRLRARRQKHENGFVLTLKGRGGSHERITEQTSERHLRSVLYAHTSVGDVARLATELALESDADDPDTTIASIINKLAEFREAGDTFIITLPVFGETSVATVVEATRESLMSESNEMSREELEAALQSLEEKKAYIEAKLAEKKGAMGHPTIAMVASGGYEAGLMLMSVEAMEMVKAMIREFLAEELPEDWVPLLDSEFGNALVDLLTPIVAHFVATHEWLPVGNKFIQKVAPPAFKGQAVLHGVKVTSIARRFVARNTQRLMKLKGMASKFEALEKAMESGGGMAMLGMVEDDYSERVRELAKEKERVER